MVKTYERTMMIKDLSKAKVKVFIHETEKEIEYTGLKSWSIYSGDDAKEIEKEFINSGLEADELGEYLRLNFTNGETATYRNTRVSLFIW